MALLAESLDELLTESGETILLESDVAGALTPPVGGGGAGYSGMFPRGRANARTLHEPHVTRPEKAKAAEKSKAVAKSRRASIGGRLVERDEVTAQLCGVGSIAGIASDGVELAGRLCGVGALAGVVDDRDGVTGALDGVWNDDDAATAFILALAA